MGRIGKKIGGSTFLSTKRPIPMKTAALFVFVLLLSVGVRAQDQQFGRPVAEENAISAKQLKSQLNGKDSARVKVVGKVNDVCRMKGCWMTIELEDGELMRVKFKDYGFFVPKDIQGRTVVFEGQAKVKTTSVAELQHYAQDAGKSKEEVAKITDPKKELTFLADGVLLKK
jgi:hypothetical protein